MAKEVECAVFCKEIAGAAASLAGNSAVVEKRVESLGSDLNIDFSASEVSSIKKLAVGIKVAR